MDSKIVRSVSLKNEISTDIEIENRGHCIRITMNGLKGSVAMNISKEQANELLQRSLGLLCE